MAAKDYYAMLQVAPGATPLQIKKAFRKLAQQYHPDKQPDNPEAAAWFSELQTAYETLTTPRLLNQYLQERWLVKASGGRFTTQGILSVGLVLEQARTLSETAAIQNQYRLDYAGWFKTIAQLLRPDIITYLNSYATATDKERFTQHIIKAVDCLPYTLQEKIVMHFDALYHKDSNVHSLLSQSNKTWKRRATWQRQQVWLVAAAAMLICFLVFWLVAAE